MMPDLCPVAVTREGQAEAEDEIQPETVSESNLMMLKKKKFYDVTFTFDGTEEKIEAHQFCLRSRSPVFDSMFCREGPLVGKKEIQLSETDPKAFREFLEFIYADKFETDPAGALDLLHLAHTYRVRPLVNKCTLLLSSDLKPEDAVRVFEAASKHGNEELMSQSAKIIALFFREIAADEGKLMDADESTWIYLLKRDDLNIGEVDLFNLLIKWGKRKLGHMSEDEHESLKKQLGNTLTLIRYVTMTPEEFTTVVVPTKVLPLEQVVDIFSYLCGNETTRQQLAVSKGLEAAPRARYTHGQFVLLLTGKNDLEFKEEGNVPLYECMGFYVSSVVCGVGSSQPQKPYITAVTLLCPKRIGTGVSHSNDVLNIRISVVKFRGSVSDDNVEHNFELRLGCTPGDERTVPVHPPIELVEGSHYCLTFQDVSAIPPGHEGKHSYSWDNYYITFNGNAKAEYQNSTITFNNVGRNNGLAAFSSSVYLCIVALRGITVSIL